MQPWQRFDTVYGVGVDDEGHPVILCNPKLFRSTRKAAQPDLRGRRQKLSLMRPFSHIGVSTYVFGVWCDVFATLGTAM